MLSLLKRATFRHGVHPEEHKQATCGLPVERMPFVDEYVLPLSQHAGKPSVPIVTTGQRIRRGELVAEADGFVSAALASPVTGEVVGVELRPNPSGRRMPALVVRTDPFDSQELSPALSPPGDDIGPPDFALEVQRAGLVGLGGAAFPTHVKLLVPEGKQVQFVIVNGCECEPYLTCDHRTMVERAEDVVRGLQLMMRQVGAGTGYVGVEINKADAIDALRAAAANDGRISVVPLAVKYPQGAEKMLIDAVLHKEVPSGRLPLDIEVIVQNVGTTTALADLFRTGKPLIERVVTVSGPGVRRPANLLVPIGTPLGAVLDHCGGVDEDVHEIVFGGPMMGLAQKRLDVPITKGISGILALKGHAPVEHELPCIRCGRCLEACPIFLNPSRLAVLARREDTTGLSDLNILDCCECASCSYVCPSHIPLVQLMRVGKAIVRSKAAG
jgi:electron transport complex protein RnfC